MRTKIRSTLMSVFLISAAAGLLLFPCLSFAEYPEQPVTIIVGFDPGAATDIMTRTLAAGAEKALGKPIIIENKGGGGGSLALAVVANAKPDGYTLCASPNVSMIDTALMQKVTFKPLKSFTPILGHSAAEHTALLVKSSSPWKTFKEFIEYAKSNPGKVKYSSSGVGTGMHIAMEVIAHKEGIKWVHVPFKGAAPALTALLGGHVDACSAGIGYQPQVLSGELRILADHGLKRPVQFPNVPTLKELGYNFYNDTIHAVVGPAGIPPEVLKKLEAAFAKGMETPEFKAAQSRLYLNPVYYNAKDYERHLKEKWASTEKLFKELAIIKESATSPN